MKWIGVRLTLGADWIYMQGMLWILQQIIPTEAGQGNLYEGNPSGTISDQTDILTHILLEPSISLNGKRGGGVGHED